MISITLQGRVPSKKNAWRRPAGKGKAYLPSQIQADIDALQVQAQLRRHGEDVKFLWGKKLRVQVQFHTKKETVDLDNAYTTLLDVLQKAGIIDNDKNVRGFNVGEFIDPTKNESVDIAIFEKI